MEILNNIWLALSTKNEILLNIISIPLMFLETYISLLLFTTLLNIKCDKKQTIKYTIIVSIVGLINLFFISAPYNIFINYIFAFIFIYIFFKISILKVFIAVIFPAIIFILIETLLLKPCLSLFNLSTAQAQSIPIYKFIFMFLTYSFVFAIICLLKSKNFKFTLLDNLNKKTKTILILNFLFGILTLSVQTYINLYYLKILPLSINIFSFISLFVYLFISIYSLTRVLKLNQTTNSLESAEEYNKSLSILHDTVRGFKHDFDNIIATLGGYIKTNDLEGLKKYYFELESDCQKANNLSALNPNLINNPGIYSLLSSKYHKADEKNIKINLEFFVDLNDLKINIYEFSRILGILLDNAIEASSECEEKFINIVFRNEEKNHRHIIIVENTYLNKDVNIEEIFKKGVSEKENHTGLGLWEIRQYIKKNTNLNLFTSKTNKLFKQQLEIYYQ